MTLERRDFIKMGTVGLAIDLASPQLGRAQATTHRSSGELIAGTSSVHLEGKLKSGVIKIEAQDFVDDKDRSLVVRGNLDSVDLYCSMFSYNQDQTVFAVLSDHGHSTTAVFSDTDDPHIGTLIVWNDGGAPDTFRVDKEKFMDTENLKASILDGRGDKLNVLGNRKPPDFTMQELETVFGSNRALLQFMRGSRSDHHPKPNVKLQAWACHGLSLLPGSLFTLFWVATG